jgi:hypothetical protein
LGKTISEDENLKFLKYCYTNDISLRDNYYYSAAIDGHLDITKYLCYIEVPFNLYCIGNAIDEGSIRIAELLYSFNAPLSNYARSMCGEYGYLGFSSWRDD